MNRTEQLGDSWDDGYNAGLQGFLMHRGRYLDRDLQVQYERGYAMGTSVREARNEERDNRFRTRYLSEHDLDALADVLDDVISRDEYYDTNHLRNLREHLFGE